MAQDAGLEATNVAGALTNMHIDELVSNLAIGIAKGQMELDKVCMDIAQFMGDAQVAFGKRAGSDEPDLLSLIELGFTPNFYQFVDTILEVRVSVSTQYEESREYDTSHTSMHQNEYQNQSSYQSSQSSSQSGYNYGYGGYGWWGWGSRYGYGGSYSGAQSSSYGTSSSYKQKNISLNTVDAKFASTYNYAVEGSSLIKTKIVPVPPPQVFDEIVRAKVQERRDWEQRMRWIDQARTILTHTASSAQSIQTDANGLAAKAMDFTKENAETVQNAVLNLRDEYHRMTLDNWSVFSGGVELRKDADTAMDTVINDAQNLADTCADPDAIPPSSELEPLIDAVSNGLTTFKSKIEALLDKLPEEDTGGGQ